MVTAAGSWQSTCDDAASTTFTCVTAHFGTVLHGADITFYTDTDSTSADYEYLYISYT